MKIYFDCLKFILYILSFFIYKLYPSTNTLIIVLISGMIFVYYIEKYKRFLFIKEEINKLNISGYLKNKYLLISLRRAGIRKWKQKK